VFVTSLHFLIATYLNRFNPKTKVSNRKYSYVIPTSVFSPSPYNQSNLKPSDYTFKENTIEYINDFLKEFLGSNNFHNFTAKSGPTSYDDPSAIRIIKSFECSLPFMIDDIQFVELTVVGQSFVMYQIRKMVGLTIALVRDGGSRHLVNACFQKPKKRIPTAPAEGLFLRECLFDAYNKFCEPHEPLDWANARENLDNFVQKVLTPNIYRYCKSEQVFEKWLAQLDTMPINYERLKITIEDFSTYKTKEEEVEEIIDGEEQPEDNQDAKDDEENSADD